MTKYFKQQIISYSNGRLQARTERFYPQKTSEDTTWILNGNSWRLFRPVSGDHYREREGSGAVKDEFLKT